MINTSPIEKCASWFLRISDNYKKLALCMLLGMGIWFGPVPQGLDVRAWKVFAVFLFTLAGMILKPIPVGAITLISLTVLTVTNVLSFNEAFSGFSNPTVWLIVLAFFIARGFIKTGIAYKLMSLLGKSTLGMAYGIVFTDWILGCAIPSVTARAGGIIYPVVTSLSEAFGSSASKNPRKMGAYLIQTIFQCGAVTSAMFLTAMAGNPMVQSFAEGRGVSITWGTWALAASVPGFICLLLIPLLMLKIYPPEVKETPEAQEFAKQKLSERGPMSFQEWVMVGAFVIMISLWVLAPYIGVNATATALIGLSLLLLSNVLTWDDILKEKGAWDTLIWFASLIAIASALSKFGMMDWLSGILQTRVEGLNWHVGFLVIALLYYYSHYFFASNIAHIASLYAPFLLLSTAIGTPPMLAALVLGFFSSLFGSLTTYGCGPAPIYYGSGFVEAKDWWRLGFLVSLLNIFVWLVLGGIWWHLIGLW